MDYRRNYQSGGTFFFTVVTCKRHRLFSNPQAVSLFREVFRQAKSENPFTLNAWVIIPDHLHMIWTLPDKDENYSKRWAKIKGNFTRIWLNAGGNELPITRGEVKDERRGIWQPRFYEHTIRDEDDCRHHVEYIHYNPVKHNVSRRPRDWELSSFHEYVKRGDFPLQWGYGTTEPLVYKPHISDDRLE